jgi:hypothetical protein
MEGVSTCHLVMEGVSTCHLKNVGSKDPTPLEINAFLEQDESGCLELH